MYASGARAQEICDLTIGDIAYDKNGTAILTLLGKGNKLRRVKITADATALLDKYIAYRKIGAHLNRHVFSSQRNEQISVSCIEEIFAKSTQIYVEITQQTVDKYMKEWNEKWFPKEETKQEILPNIQSSLPEFLQ